MGTKRGYFEKSPSREQPPLSESIADPRVAFILRNARPWLEADVWHRGIDIKKLREELNQEFVHMNPNSRKRGILPFDKWSARDDLVRELEKDPDSVRKMLESCAFSYIMLLLGERKSLASIRRQVQETLAGQRTNLQQHQAEAMQKVLDLMGDDLAHEYSKEQKA